MNKYRKKPVVIEAVQWKGDNVKDIIALHGELGEPASRIIYGHWDGHLIIQTLEGNMRADLNDWIIKGVNGELYPCKPDIFAKTYEIVNE